MKVRILVFILGMLITVMGAIVVLTMWRHTLYWIPGVIMIVIGVIITYTIGKKDDKVFLKEIERLKAELRQNGEAVRVEFLKCEVKTNDYSEEREIGYSHRVQFYNALQDERKNTEIVEVYQSVIVFKYEHEGITETFYSHIITKEREHLLFILDTKKETMLYIDKNDRERYFFDLDFLDKH